MAPGMTKTCPVYLGVLQQRKGRKGERGEEKGVLFVEYSFN